ncbi:hypothetical protein EV421DRAFT_1669536, partial [Armillaria borealis]
EHVLVYADYICSNCDMPTARKISEQAGHATDLHPCPYCKTMLLDVNKAESYADNSAERKDDYKLLQHAFRSCDAPIQCQNQILKDYGIWWSTVNLLPDWLPVKKTALDFMHAVFLGIIMYLFMQVLFAAYMFLGFGGQDLAKQQFEDCINSIHWRSHITRLPKNMGENQSLKKADEWQHLITMTPVLLWVT